MTRVRILYHLAKADFFERVRRYGFLITLGITLYLEYVFVPPSNARYVTMEITGHRAFYTSAYVGSSLAVLTSVFLSLIGFYLVKNALDRDIQTRVGQILAATPLTKPLYTLGKALSNFAVLSTIVAAMALAAGIIQLIRHEDMAIHVGQLLAPFLLVTLPVMALVGSIAILFETVRWLRGGLGNVAYFVLWLVALMAFVARYDALRRGPFNDVLGLGTVVPSLAAACEAAFPGCTGSAFTFSAGLTLKEPGGSWDLKTFHWQGVHWTPEIVLGRLMWIGVAAALALLASTFFDRFDPARERVKRAQVESAELPEPELGRPQPAPTRVSLSAVEPALQQFRFRAMVVAELRLALRGVSRWWYLVAAVLIIGEVASPLAISRFWLIGAWIWPLLIWSAMGTREARQGTRQLVFSVAHPLRRQLPACWLAGLIISALTGAGTAVRLLISGDPSGLAAWLAGALFIPTLALSLGVSSGSSKLFEVVYLLLWYTGPVSGLSTLDYMGVTHANLPSRTPIVFLTCTVILACLALAGRKRQIRI